MNEQTRPDALYPPIEPFDAGWLDVGDGHRIYYEQCGQPAGRPVLFLHGGPGSGCSPRHRRLVNPRDCRVILFDQRGCGRSQPRGSVQANTSTHLLADIERLRAQLGIDRWLVFGGSWGAGLALAYAAAHPAACNALVLRAVFLGRAGDLDWFFRDARDLLPEAWQALAQLAPPARRDELLGWLHQALHEGTPAEALHCAQAWQNWEATLTGGSAPGFAPSGDAAAALVDKYRVQSHYLVHGCFWGESSLLARAAGLGALPTAILHGQNDAICRPSSASDLQAALPGSRLQWLPGCGHSPFEPAMARALDQAVQHVMHQGDFRAWGERSLMQEDA